MKYNYLFDSEFEEFDDPSVDDNSDVVHASNSENTLNMEPLNDQLLKDIKEYKLIHSYNLKNYEDLYFVTYKYQKGNPKAVSELDYKKVIDFMNKHGELSLFAFEKDSDERLHLHALYKSKKNLFQRMFKFPNYTCKIENVDDSNKSIQTLEKYILKSHI